MTERNRSGRVPFECLEVDQDFCQESYGVAPCGASLATGGKKCFNTRATCQDPANYNKGALTLRFVKNQQDLPNDGNYYIPSLVSVRTTNARLNPGGGNRSASAMGELSTLSATFQDHAHTDRLVDPYVAERDYDPLQRGTFWTKWRARNPYYLHREVRYISGYLKDGQIVEATTRTFVITGFSGPDGSDRVTLQAKSVLTLLTGKKAKAPAVSTGKLKTAITAADTSVQLEPAGVGDKEYPASGDIAIGKEVCAFTRSGDVLTLTRGQENTPAEDHDAGDVAQLCLRFTAAEPWEIFRVLTEESAGIPSKYLDKAQWAEEGTNYLPRRYSALIPEPKDVDQLVGEITEQMYFYPLYDERDAKVRIRAIRPDQDDQVYDLGSDRHLVQGSVRWRDLSDELITHVLVRYGMRNPFEDDEPENFAARELIISDEFTEDKQGIMRLKEINSRWITGANGAAAIELGENLLTRYKQVPRQCSFSLDAKDSEIWLGDFVRISHRQAVDDTGADKPINLQVFEVGEPQAGTRFDYVAKEFQFAEVGDPGDRLIVISTNQVNVNLRDLHDQLYDSPQGGENVRVVVRSGVIIGGQNTHHDVYTGDATSVATLNFGLGPIESDVNMRPVMMYQYQGSRLVSPFFKAINDTIEIAGKPYVVTTDLWVVPAPVSLSVGSWPANVTITLEIEPGAEILSAGGLGCFHNAYPQAKDEFNVSIVSQGGIAMEGGYPITVDNRGLIAAAGCSGGGYPNTRSAGAMLIPGAGGAGYHPGGTLTVYDTDSQFGVIRQPAVGGTAAGGVGAIIDTNVGDSNSTKWYSGAGGALNSEGERFFLDTEEGFYHGIANNLVSPAIISASSITWINQGDVRGAINS